MSSACRCSRLSVVATLGAAATCVISAELLLEDSEVMMMGTGAIAAAAIVVQIVAPFSERHSKRMAESSDWWKSLEGLGEALAHVGSNGTLSNEKHNHVSALAELPVKTGISDDSVTAASASLVENDNDWWELPEESRPAASASTLAGAASDHLPDTSETDEPLKARMPALVLSLVPFIMMPFFGLHRFYTGKVFSGIIYLLTLGLFGIGQLVDVILIALGEFRDSEGRLLTTWRSSSGELSTAGEKVNSLSVIPSPRNLFSDGLAVVGGIFLTLDIALGFLLAINGPKLISAGMFSPIGLSPELMTDILGMADWQGIVFELWAVVCGILSAATVGLLMTSRLRYGVAHVARVIPAGGALGGVFAMLMEGTRRIQWELGVNSLNRHQAGPALQSILSGDLIACLIGSAVAFSAALFILAWPPRHTVTPVAAPVRTPVSQEHS